MIALKSVLSVNYRSVRGQSYGMKEMDEPEIWDTTSYIGRGSCAERRTL